MKMKLLMWPFTFELSIQTDLIPNVKDTSYIAIDMPYAFTEA